MAFPLNIPAALIANVMGLSILFCVAVISFRAVTLSPADRKILLIMMLASGLSCVADPVCFLTDGRPGLLCRVLVYGCNTWLYLGNILIALGWIFLVATHLHLHLSKAHRRALALLSGGGAALLAVNLFFPIVFSVDDSNAYVRAGGYALYGVLLLFLLADGLVLYFRVRRMSRNIKFFPAWAFVIPVLIGGLIQSRFYGLSTITPFITVSICCITSCLQNEFLHKDKLTGLYNRFYLELFEKRIAETHSNQYTMMMLDINRFKDINDTYGHRTGDRALIRMAELLRQVIGQNGEVIRYAGDEFVIILNTQQALQTQQTIDAIQEALVQFNLHSGEPYQLSVALGHCKLDLRSHTLDQLFDRVDKLMYENKSLCHRLTAQTPESDH